MNRFSKKLTRLIGTKRKRKKNKKKNKKKKNKNETFFDKLMKMLICDYSE